MQSEHIRKSMQSNKGRDTKPELLLRKELRKAGFPGYRLQWRKVPGRPDIAYPGRKIAIFVNGCFWHRCPNCQPSMPKTNVEFWTTKFEQNAERDLRNYDELERMGWKVIVVWECELKKERLRGTIDYVLIELEPDDSSSGEDPCRCSDDC
jgi:DNA mismatch endonuclease (patch repair protein)